MITEGSRILMGSDQRRGTHQLQDGGQRGLLEAGGSSAGGGTRDIWSVGGRASEGGGERASQ